MPADLAADPPWSRLSELIAQKTGLHFPPERSVDLQRALSGAAGEFGFSDALACADWLVSTRLTSAQLQVLAGHLTVGETYFFRERPTFAALAEHVIPELARRRWHERRLRVWSAACCTGEEAYANQGKLSEALTSCDRWIGTAPLDSAARYLRAVILQELGEYQSARLALNQALYLNPEFVLAHFALGNLDKAGGKGNEAGKHFANALTLVRRAPPTELLPESDGLTARHLEEIIMTLLQTETTS